MSSVASPIASSIQLIERVEPRFRTEKHRLPGHTPTAVVQLRSGWLDDQLIKWRWIEKAQAENNYACFECGLVDLRPALQVELAQRTEIEEAEVAEQLLVDQCLLQVFDAIATEGLSLHDALESVLASFSHGIAA